MTPIRTAKIRTLHRLRDESIPAWSTAPVGRIVLGLLAAALAAAAGTWLRTPGRGGGGPRLVGAVERSRPV